MSFIPALDTWLHAFEQRLDIVARFENFVDGPADEWQKRALQCQTETLAIRVCRQAGKSSVLATLAIVAMEAGMTALILAPAERQGKELTRRLKEFLPKTDLVIERSTLTEVETKGGGRLIAIPATADTIRGYTVDLLLIDEAAFCNEESIAAVLPMVTDFGRVIFASTTGARTGTFAQIFLNKSGKPGIERIVVRGTEIPRLTRKVERMRATLAPHKFRQEVEVEFLRDGETFFDMAAIARAQSPEMALAL